MLFQYRLMRRIAGEAQEMDRTSEEMRRKTKKMRRKTTKMLKLRYMKLVSMRALIIYTIAH